MATQIEAKRIAAVLTEQRQTIVRRWLDTVVTKTRGRRTSAEVEQELEPMFDALASALNGGASDVSDGQLDELRAMLAEYSRSRARQGFTPSETALAIFMLRDAVISTISEREPSALGEIAGLSRMLDDLGLVTFEAYAQTRESVITNQAEQLLELSTPVVKVWDGIVAVPLVGTLDSARTQVVMESLLQTLVSTGSAHAIIDITGVPAVDTQVAQHLLNTVVAARLMGAQCVISGIRPQIAQTIVALGIEFGDIATKATLADALRLTLQRAGLEIRKIAKTA
ncbi:MAG TPA: STAS domain-containing protein [Candidatus Baltobacteraceae bacterium]|nr:STAS domain-containing protein [Candidatus Baltobacteraceae bacterium]